MTRKVKIAIIGAGTAGLTALGVVRKRTEDFILINDGPYGTTCARVGCMPSKALIQVANDFHRRLALDGLGIRGAEALSVDLPAALHRVREVRDYLVGNVLKATDNLGDRNLPGRARLEGPNRIRVGEELIEAEKIILATGSRPVVPEAWRDLGDRLLTSDNLFEQTDLPPRIAVIGLGIIGLELGQALARLGLEVHGFELRSVIGGVTDPVIAQQVQQLMSQDFPLYLGHPAHIERQADGLHLSAGEASVVVDKVLVAMGRRPNVDELGLETLGVPLDAQGIPSFDRQTMQIGDLPVFITGDMNAERPVLHEASDEGYIAAQNALADSPRAYRRRTPLAIAFTDPEIALAGATHAELAGSDPLIGGISFETQSRALVAARNKGHLRVYVERGSGRLLGSEMIVPGAEHFGHLLALAIQQGMTFTQLLQMPFYHPVLEEGLRAALRELGRQCLDPARRAELEAL